MPTLLFSRLMRLPLLLAVAALLLSSCASTRYYNQRTMFRLTDKKGTFIDTSKLRVAVNRTAKNYLIQPNDYLEVRVYTNKGERILDPNGDFPFGQPGSTVGASSRGATTNSRGGQRTTQGSGATSTGSEFLVQADGTVTLPLLSAPVKVQGLSLLQADSVLKSSYRAYYKEPFVTTHVTNNRIFVLGAPGGQVVTLANDNMNLLEVLALAGGIDGAGAAGSTLFRFGGNATNIRIIRGDLKNPQIQQIDLTTIDGMRKANLQMEPNDIVYVEPVRRPFLDGLTDAGPAISAAALVLNAVAIFVTILRF